MERIQARRMYHGHDGRISHNCDENHHSSRMNNSVQTDQMNYRNQVNKISRNTIHAESFLRRKERSKYENKNQLFEPFVSLVMMMLLLLVQETNAGKSSANITHGNFGSPANQVELFSELVSHKSGSFIGDLYNRTSTGAKNHSEQLIDRLHKSNMIRSLTKRDTDDLFGPPSDTCTVTEGELTKLADSLQSATEELSKSDASQAPVRNSDSSCSTVVSFVKNQASYIVKQVKLLKQVGLVDTETHEVLKAEYKRALEQFNKIVDNLKRSSSQDQSRIISNFNTKLAEFQKKVNDLAGTIDILNKKNKEKTVDLCASQIKNSEYQSALTEFNSLNDDSQLNGIVHRAYNKDTSNIEKLLDFTRKLPKCSQDAIALPALFNEMATNRQLTNPNIVSLMDATRTCPASLKNLITQLKVYSDDIISSWAKKVQGNDYEAIQKYAKQSARSADSIHYHLPEIVKQAYASNVDNFESILNFLLTLPWRSHLQKGYAALLDEMKQNNHLYNDKTIRLAYRVKQAMTMIGNPAVATELEQPFLALKNNFPEGIRNLIWNAECTIKNTLWNEYLYANDNEFYDRSEFNRIVFTWIPGNQVLQGTWIFEPVNNASAFRIKNEHHNEYLMSGTFYDDDDDGQRRQVYTESKNAHGWNPSNYISPTSEWKLEPEIDGNTYRIKTNYHTGYVYAANNHWNFNSDRRRVFTWIPGEPLAKGIWELDCN